MKKRISMLLSAVILLSQASGVLADDQKYSILKLAYPKSAQEMDYQTYSHLMARYADDKTPIPLSVYYDGNIFASVSPENVSRKIEYFLSEEQTFLDSNDSLEMYYMESLSARGVVSGDENGKANPGIPLTRAEAVSMLVRLFGLPMSENKSSYADVPEDVWYQTAVSAAEKAGILENREYFRAQEAISREEFTEMVGKAALYTGMWEEKENPEEYLKTKIKPADLDAVSDSSMAAYALLGYLAPCDYESVDRGEEEPDTITYFSPKKPILRYEAAEVLGNVCDRIQIYPSETAIEYGFDQEMPVIDGSTSTYPFTEAIYSSLFLNGLTHPQKPEKHSKSHASYERLINKEVDAIIASVYPAEDILELAREHGVELELVPIAYDAMIFFTNIDNPAKNLTLQQISDIYVDNKYTNWNEIGGTDALLYPYCRNNDSGSHAQMQRHFLKGKEINEKIRVENTSLTMSSILTEVIGAETADPKGYGLGYSIYYYFQNMDLVMDTKKDLKLLSIDGIAPNDETIANGSYPLSNNTYVVIRKDEPENSKARRFADFMLSPTGQQCVAMAGFGPLKPVE